MSEKFTHTVEFYKDASGDWRWRAKSRNGNIVADSSEGYREKRRAERAVKNLFAGVIRWKTFE